MKQLLITISAVVLVGCGPTVPDISITTASWHGNIEVVKQHLAAGTDLNAKDMHGNASLHHAAERGHKEIVELLIANDADVNVKEKNTPIHKAAMNGHKDIAELLIANGADVNAKSFDNNQLLRTMALGMYPAWAEKNSAGLTPLHLVKTKEIAKLLITKGADVNAQNAVGNTPLNFAINGIFGENKEIADLLRKHGAKTAEELKAEGK